MQRQGLFITIEGGDGSGKSTLIESLYQYLTTKNLPLLLTREPGGTKIGEGIRKVLLQTSKDELFSPRAELTLYLASRSQHVEEIILPALQEDKIVLCDRFNDSSIAYQGVGRELGFDEVEKFCLFCSQGLMPDFTLYLDIDPEVGINRIKKAKRDIDTECDRIEAEKIQFHERVRYGYKLLMEKYPKRFELIDASLSPEKVLEDSIHSIEKFLQKTGKLSP